MKKRYEFTSGEVIFADAVELKLMLEQNRSYLDNYLDLYASQDDAEYVARGNGFCDSKFSSDFLEGQISDYRSRVADLQKWLEAL